MHNHERLIIRFRMFYRKNFKEYLVSKYFSLLLASHPVD
nr:MAG TPA: hypothetical protein [Caudoviricetes sp.]